MARVNCIMWMLCIYNIIELALSSYFYIIFFCYVYFFFQSHSLICCQCCRNILLEERIVSCRKSLWKQWKMAKEFTTTLLRY